MTRLLLFSITALWSLSALAGGPLVALQSVTSGLNAPLALRHAGDGSERLFVVEQGGRIRIIDAMGALESVPFLDISALISAGGERGLLGLAFHPDYAVNGLFFVNYTDPAGDTVVARYSVDAMNADLADPASAQVLLRVDQDFSNHNGGDLHFGPDGYLYIGLGDGGNAGDPCSRAQTLDPADLDGSANCTIDAAFTGSGGNPDSLALLGKMLRIDVDATTPAGSNELCAAAADGSAPYAVPVDNPFARADGACDEVWALGLRNPFRFSFDRDNGDLWIGDVGQNAIEEIDLEPFALQAEIFADGFESRGGINYGWDCREGSTAYIAPSPLCTGSGYTGPVMEYGHSAGRCSVTGGYRYRGLDVAQLTGRYVFGDYCTGEIFIGSESGGNWSFSVDQDTSLNISSFGEDENGALYVVDLGGDVFRLVAP